MLEHHAEGANTRYLQLSFAKILCVDMANLATKPSSLHDGLVARLDISTNIPHETDLSASRSGTIVCPRTQVTNPKVSPTGDPTPHNAYYTSSLQYTQRQVHDSINISTLQLPESNRGSSGLCSRFVEMDNLSTKPSSGNDGLVDRLAISTFDILECCDGDRSYGGPYS